MTPLSFLLYLYVTICWKMGKIFPSFNKFFQKKFHEGVKVGMKVENDTSYHFYCFFVTIPPKIWTLVLKRPNSWCSAFKINSHLKKMIPTCHLKIPTLGENSPILDTLRREAAAGLRTRLPYDCFEAAHYISVASHSWVCYLNLLLHASIFRGLQDLLGAQNLKTTWSEYYLQTCKTEIFEGIITIINLLFTIFLQYQLKHLQK